MADEQFVQQRDEIARSVKCERNSSSEANPAGGPFDCTGWAAAKIKASGAINCTQDRRTPAFSPPPFLRESGSSPFPALPAPVRQLVNHSLSENTRRGYQADLEHYAATGRTMPSTPEAVANYLAECVGLCAVSTMQRRLAAIAKAHAAIGADDPTKAELVRATMRGIRRTLGVAQREAKPILREDLFQMLELMGDRLKDLRDKALLLTGFAGAFRRSELVALDIADIEHVRQGIIITLRQSKTDQTGAGRKVGLPFGRTRWCPVKHLTDWLRHAEIESGPIFRVINRHGHVADQRLSGEAVSIIVKERAKAAGFNPDAYSGHSLPAAIAKPNGRIVDYIGVTSHLDEALQSYRSEDVENAMRDIAVLRNALKEAHARYRAQKRAMGLEGMDEKAAAYAAAKIAADGREDDWFDLQRLTRAFIKVYADLSPDPAILEFTAEVKWAAAFLRLATQALSKDESLDHRSYSAKIREMLEQHVHVTGLSTTIRLRNITDPNFAVDFDTGGKTEPELQEAFVRKSAELRRTTRELVDKNPAQYGRFSERVLEIIRRFEEGQLAAAEGLREFEGLTGDIHAEQGAHAVLGMDENAFSILRIIEAIVPDADHATLQDTAIAIGAIYADAAATQPAFAHMDAYLRSLRQQVRRILTEHGIGETKTIREKVEEFAIHAYGGGA